MAMKTLKDELQGAIVTLLYEGHDREGLVCEYDETTGVAMIDFFEEGVIQEISLGGVPIMSEAESHAVDAGETDNLTGTGRQQANAVSSETVGTAEKSSGPLGDSHVSGVEYQKDLHMPREREYTSLTANDGGTVRRIQVTQIEDTEPSNGQYSSDGPPQGESMRNGRGAEMRKVACGSGGEVSLPPGFFPRREQQSKEERRPWCERREQRTVPEVKGSPPDRGYTRMMEKSSSRITTSNSRPSSSGWSSDGTVRDCLNERYREKRQSQNVSSPVQVGRKYFSAAGGFLIERKNFHRVLREWICNGDKSKQTLMVYKRKYGQEYLSFMRYLRRTYPQCFNQTLVDIILARKFSYQRQKKESIKRKPRVHKRVLPRRKRVKQSNNQRGVARDFASFLRWHG